MCSLDSGSILKSGLVIKSRLCEVLLMKLGHTGKNRDYLDKGIILDSLQEPIMEFFDVVRHRDKECRMVGGSA